LLECRGHAGDLRSTVADIFRAAKTFASFSASNFLERSQPADSRVDHVCQVMPMGKTGVMRSSRPFMAVVVAVAVATVAAGCADTTERRDAIAGVALRLLTAVADRDGTAACTVLAPDTLAELEQSAGASCPDAILEEDLPEPAEVRHVDVYGQWARVVLADDTLFLAAFPGGWRVVAAGCQAQGERPYDCVLQGG
jgi:hypothetical protein